MSVKIVNIKDIKIFDLTEIFGAGNEPSESMIKAMYLQYITKMIIKKEITYLLGGITEVD